MHEDIDDFRPASAESSPGGGAALDESFMKEAKRQTTVRDLLQLHARRVDDVNGNNLGYLWSSIGRLSRMSRPEHQWLMSNQPLLEPALAHLETHLDGLEPYALAGVAKGLSSQRRRGLASNRCWRRLAELTTSKRGSFDDHSLVSMLDSCSRAGRIGPNVFSALTQEMVARAAAEPLRFSPVSLSLLLRSCARVKFRSQPLLVACAAGLHQRPDELPLPLLIDVGWSYAALDHRPLSLFGVAAPFRARLLDVLTKEDEASPVTAAAPATAAADAANHDVGEEEEESNEEEESGGGGGGGTARRPRGPGIYRYARVHQWRLWLDYERKSEDATSGIAEESALATRCRDAFIEMQCAEPRRQGRASAGVRECRQALLELGYLPEEVVTPRGYVHEVVVRVDGTPVAVELEAPAGLVHTSKQGRRAPQAGWLALRHRQLRFFADAEGAEQLVSIPLSDMRPVASSDDAQRELRRQRLEAALRENARGGAPQ